MARRNIDAMEKAAGSLDSLDAIITNAAGCGSHLKHYDHLLADDPAYAERAKLWSTRMRDIHEWLVEIGPVAPAGDGKPQTVTYHEACHLCHGQKITSQPRALLKLIPGLELVELPESSWCCGSAGVYNITQPEMSAKLLKRKLGHIAVTGAPIVASANPGCNVQLEAGMLGSTMTTKVVHPITLLAQAYREGAEARQ
jgi:glycolate oxidase iron-sulfur subunit